MVIIDDFLEKDNLEYVTNYCLKSSYTYGETDRKTTPPTGMIHSIKSNENIYNLFESKIRESNIAKGMHLYRMYVNCFAPSENPYFHRDSDVGLTFLFYINDWKLDDGGETQFLIDDEIKGVLPLPNRIVGFDSYIWHKATTFRDKHRFTLAIKFE
tara:strand:+ start:93 stop:560 length:468 start_codon:yes stop_codon:yes gene_type:complete